MKDGEVKKREDRREVEEVKEGEEGQRGVERRGVGMRGRGANKVEEGEMVGMEERGFSHCLLYLPCQLICTKRQD